MAKKEEIKRLKRISRSPSFRRVARPRSKSRSASVGKKRPFMGGEKNHERWTNCYARKSVEWDSRDAILERERKYLENPDRIEKYPTSCCGNSPSKSHTNYCHIPRINEHNISNFGAATPQKQL